MSQSTLQAMQQAIAAQSQQNYNNYGAIGGTVSYPITYGSTSQSNWTFTTTVSPAVSHGTLVQLMDASGRLINFEVDPSVLHLISLINTTHASKHPSPWPTSAPQNLPVMEEDFTLDEIAKAEELMEELGV